MRQDKIIRISYRTFTKITKLFPPAEKETTKAYFDRLAAWLENEHS